MGAPAVPEQGFARVKAPPGGQLSDANPSRSFRTHFIPAEKADVPIARNRPKISGRGDPLLAAPAHLVSMSKE
jgi:hypothetical protein